MIKMRIAVLGARSFSGSFFCEAAELAGHAVLRLNRPEHDLTLNPMAIVQETMLWAATHFVNFAALNMVAESWRFAADYYRTNVEGVCRLVDELAKWGELQKFVQVSTPEVYGAMGIKLVESTDYHPSTPYAVSRAAADMHLHAMAATRGFPVCFTRTVNVYGPRQQAYRIIPKTVLSICKGARLGLHGGGVSERSFIHIRDVARGTLLVASEGVPGEIYHMAVPEMVAIVDLVRSICRMMGKRLEDVADVEAERPGKDRMYFLDYEKMRAMSWKADIAFTEGLESTVRWFAERHAEYKLSDLNYEHRS